MVAGALAGITVAAAASVMSAGPARASCAQWSYNGTFNIHQDNELRVQVSGWSGTQAGGAQAALFLADGTPAMVDMDNGKAVQHGKHSDLNHEIDSPQVGQILRGGAISGNQIKFTVNWGQLDPIVRNTYTGTIADNGAGAKGTTLNSAGASNNWFATDQFTCAT